MSADVEVGDGRYAYAVRERPRIVPVFDYTNAVTDDDAGVYVPPVLVGTARDGREPDLPPGFPSSRQVYRRLADGTPLVSTRGQSHRRGQWLVVVTVVPAGATFTAATVPADHSRISPGWLPDDLPPFGPDGPDVDYLTAGAPWDFFDVTQWALNDGQAIPGKMRGVGT